ncbi:MAG: GntR family transcriptional regulator [Bacteroidales bacterium]|jgi:DNA-binding transcriptional regulator YhcF (GntR family)|nr:GntR family transcriptional regulator [Bacteroidales bacterium]
MQFKEKQAIYMQIADYVCDNILTGKWPLEEKILSVRDLGVKLEVNPNTVMRSYEYLQQQNIIFNKRGIGFFVAADAINIILQIRKKRFFETELSDFFKTLKLLNIDMQEIVEYYKNHV